MRKIFVFLLFICSINTVLLAQQISLPYECGFEDAAEIDNWKLNAGTKGPLCNDQWMVGNLDNNGGFNSMYISCDTGKTTTYGAKPNVVIAYRTLEVFLFLFSQIKTIYHFSPEVKVKVLPLVEDDQYCQESLPDKVAAGGIYLKALGKVAEVLEEANSDSEPKKFSGNI